MNLRVAFASLLLCTLAAAAQQSPSTVPGEPANVGVLKRELVRYYECHEDACYFPQFQRQIALASTALRDSIAVAKSGEKLAMVLDIDETSLSNWLVMRHDDFGYIPADTNWCMELHCDTVLPPTLQLYKQAVAADVAVFFITGRPEPQRADTEATLRSAGFVSWSGLAFRPVPFVSTVTDYKSSQRGQIVKAGYRIVLNVGDQLSDLLGPYPADHSIKLPNPFYFIP